MGYGRYLGAMLASLAIATPAQACTLCSCTAATSGVAFGTYDATAAAPDDASGTITLNCTGLISLAGTIVIALSPGASGDPANRTMLQGASQLTYNLYTNAGRTTVWGNGTGGTSTVSSTLNGLLFFSQTVNVYGRVPAHQWVKAGSYADSVIVTVTY